MEQMLNSKGRCFGLNRVKDQNKLISNKFRMLVNLAENRCMIWSNRIFSTFKPATNWISNIFSILQLFSNILHYLCNVSINN